MSRSSTTKSVALVCCFASIYAVFSSWSLFPVLGATGKFITMAVVAAPLIGILLGPWLGVAAITLGGIMEGMVLQMGTFGAMSFVPRAAAALCSGFLFDGKRWISALLYSTLLLFFAFYPVVGPVWLHPYFVWLQIGGLILLVSPLQLKAAEFVQKSTNLLDLSLGIGLVSFTATLFGHIVGSMMFEILYWPIVFPETDFWRGLWQILTYIYPVERLIIATIATIIGTPLFRALKAYGFKGGSANATF